MMMRIPPVRPLLALVALALVPGCSGKKSDPVLATIGDRTITVSAFKEAWQGLPDSEKPPIETAEDRTKFLDDLINKDLLELESVRRQPELDEGQRRRLHRFAQTQLMTLLTEVEINEKIGVEESEIREVYERMGREYKTRHIVVPTQEEARQIEQELRNGADFATLARERSKDPQSGPRGGDLGWVKAGSMVSAFDRLLFTMKAGDLSPPVLTRFGWHVILAEEVREVEQPGLETVRDAIYVALLQERSLARQEQFQEELRNRAKPENQLSTLQILDRKYYFEVPASAANDPYAALNTHREIPAFSQEELALPVIKFADRPHFTIRDFNEALTWRPPGVWPSGKGLDELEIILRQLLREKLYRDHAYSLGLEKRPDYVRTIKKKEMEMRVNNLYFNGIVATITPSEQQKRDFFERHRDHYKIVDRYRLSRIDTADSTVAALAARTWRTGKDFADVESMVLGLDGAARTVAGSPETPRGQSDVLDQIIFAETTKIGDVIGPVWLEATVDESGNTSPPRWTVARILDVKPERFMTYDEAQALVAEHTKTSLTEEALKAVLAECRTRFNVKVDEAAVAAVDPAEIQAAPTPTT
jgi:peptidyl-prolyl cis-trans isomerase C